MKTTIATSRLLLVCLWFLVRVAHAEAVSKLDPRIFTGKAAGQTASFLVVMREQADLSGAGAFTEKADKGRFVFEALTAVAETSQAPLKARLDAAGVPYRSFYLVNMIEVEAERSLAEELAARNDVSSIAPNPEVPLEPQPIVEQQPSPSASRLSPAAATTVEPNIALVGAPAVWSRGFTGQGIVIGMADTGVTWDHPALKSHYRGFNGTTVSHDYNWHDAVHQPPRLFTVLSRRRGNAQRIAFRLSAGAINPCGYDLQAPCDDLGHGTSTTSLVVGDDGAGMQVGMAPGARFIACRNMDLNTGSVARYTECFQFFLAPTDHNGQNPRPDLAAHVVNNSWGCTTPPEDCFDPNVLESVVENVRAAGIVVVVSAGNDGSRGCSSITDPPAIYDASFTIGATTSADAIATFSSRGPVTVDGSNRLKPDICAPGVSLTVAVPPSSYATRSFSGTSGSAPHVAGAVALLWSAAPQYVGQVAATMDLFKRTAIPLTSTQNCGSFPGSVVPNPVFGSGRLDVAAAVSGAHLP